MGEILQKYRVLAYNTYMIWVLGTRLKALYEVYIAYPQYISSSTCQRAREIALAIG